MFTNGVRVNAVVPGATVSAMTAESLTGDHTDLTGAEAALADTALLGRPIQPDDIAAAVAFLASADGAMITGHTLTVDAGLTAIAGPSTFATGDYTEPATPRPPAY